VAFPSVVTDRWSTVEYPTTGGEQTSSASSSLVQFEADLMDLHLGSRLSAQRCEIAEHLFGFHLDWKWT
jgi:hypothetical protein